MSGPPPSSTPHSRLTGLRPEALMAQALPNSSTQIVMVPGFELQTMIGRGGMGAVFLAKQTRLDREVAVKVLAGELVGDALFMERIEREARTMARLRHPNVVTVHDFLPLEDGGAAIVMEYVEGGSLRDKLRLHPLGLPVVEGMRTLRQIAAGLEAAHASGVIHRDMKPENVLLDLSGTARVTDFGLALPLQEGVVRLTLTGTTVGTVDYMAPEQLKGGEQDVRLDIFALGVMAYEMLTGQTPRGSFDAPHRARPEVPRHVGEAVMKAMRPNPGERFASVEEFMLAMHPSQAGKAARSFQKIMGVMAAVLVVTAVILWGAMNRPEEARAANAPSASPPESDVAPSRAPLPTPIPPVEAASPVMAQSGPTVKPAPVVQMAPTEPGEWRDAIAGLRIHEDNFGGDWTHEDGILTSNDAICVMALEKDLPEDYDVRMKFTRLSGAHSVTLFFRSNWTVGSAELDAWDEGLAGVQAISGETLQAGYGFRFPLENGRSYELLVEVRQGAARMSVDGVFQKEFNTQGKFLAPPSPWGWNAMERPAALAVGSYQSPTRFEKVEWRANPSAFPAKQAAESPR